MKQTKTGSSSNAWIDYMKVCAKNYKEAKELAAGTENASVAKPSRKDEKGTKTKQETNENSKSALRKEHDMKETRKKKHREVAKQIKPQ
jgi:hypothetical protein